MARFQEALRFSYEKVTSKLETTRCSSSFAGLNMVGGAIVVGTLVTVPLASLARLGQRRGFTRTLVADVSATIAGARSTSC